MLHRVFELVVVFDQVEFDELSHPIDQLHILPAGNIFDFEKENFVYFIFTFGKFCVQCSLTFLSVEYL
jgi:hypothetical protein